MHEFWALCSQTSGMEQVICFLRVKNESSGTVLLGTDRLLHTLILMSICSSSQDLAAIINNNAHGVGAANTSNTDSALGVYPALSMLNHSCLPNSVFASCGAHAMQSPSMSTAFPTKEHYDNTCMDQLEPSDMIMRRGGSPSDLLCQRDRSRKQHS